GVVRLYSGANGSLLWSIQGPNSGSSFGASLAALGDVDGDGRGDLAIGAPLANLTGAVGCGIVRVVSGASGATLRQFRGDSAGDHLGWSVGCAGDVDHDGVPDVLGGAVDDDDTGDSAGSVRVWSGATGAVIHTYFGGTMRELLGSSVDGGADVDGDGTNDLVAGGAYFSSAPQGGVVRVFSGATFAMLWSTAIAPARDALGSSVAFVGDLDGDGRSEVLAGARQPFAGAAGYARLYSGANGALLRHIAAGSLQRAFGTSVTAAGDIDFDGLPEFAIGAPDSSTGGTLSGVVRLYSGATAAVLTDYVGLTGSHLGTSVRGGGDISGEGFPDLLLGAPTETAAGIQAGAAYAFRGSDAPPPDSDGDGTPDIFDGCPNDPHKIAPGACGCGVADTDSDGDGVANCNDGCPDDAGKLAPGACGCGIADTDSDGDGTPDCNDGCPSDPNKIAPGVCGCGVADTDSDGDGALDCVDGCPNDAGKMAPGACGCGIADTDSDGDGMPNCNDGCPNDPHKIGPGSCGCGVADIDSDGDGTPDCHDGCPLNASLTSPGPCGCVAATDIDNDGTPDCLDGCPEDPLKVLAGVCGCGHPDVDVDHNGVFDCLENMSPLAADVLELRYGSNVPQHLTLRAGQAHAGRRFLMLGSLHGTEPGFDMQGVHVPLVIDSYLQHNLLPHFPSAIVPVLGILDAEGVGHVEIQVSKLHGRGAWVGRTIHHAYIVLGEGCSVKFASNAVPLKILP
ncbi:MAG TPA: integrin alpha, partial [Planctomycetota bacterium]|nr:integrin alpha [Planctomycetota bacterium]